MRRLARAAERLAFGAVWLLVVAVISLGAAGVVAALDHQPGTPARAELTWVADREAAPALEAATDDVAAISAALDELGVRGRGALAALSAREWDVLDTAIGEGSVLVSDLRERVSVVRSRLVGLTAFGPGAELRLSPETRSRHAALLAALDSTDGLGEAWARLVSGGTAASRLSGLLERHDEQVASAIEVGRVGSFPTALRRIAAAEATLAEADRLRAQLENTSDVATLNEWLRRNREYVVALRALYEASAASGERVTPQLRAALAAERRAREELPESTNALGIIMADIGQGGLNQAVIGIEVARGELASALAAMRAPAGSVNP